MIIMTAYGLIDRKPYDVAIVVKRETKEELVKDFPDAYDIKES